MFLQCFTRFFRENSKKVKMFRKISLLFAIMAVESSVGRLITEPLEVVVKFYETDSRISSLDFSMAPEQPLGDFT